MKSLVTLAALVAATIGSAGAATIQYSTVGSTFTTGSNIFTVSSGANTLTFTFTPIAPTTVTVPTGISYGLFDVSYVGDPTATITVPAFQLNLRVNNLSGGGTGTFAVTSPGGSVSAAQNTVSVSFAPVPLVVGGASFTANTPLNLVSDATLAGQTTFQGSVNNPTVPEPGTMLLLGAGLLGVGFTARKKLTNRS